jgi:hypothetical protein
MKLSEQAMVCIMGALQKCILEQSDIVPILKDLEFDKSPNVSRWGGTGELVIKNPPKFSMSVPGAEVEQ